MKADIHRVQVFGATAIRYGVHTLAGVFAGAFLHIGNGVIEEHAIVDNVARSVVVGGSRHTAVVTADIPSADQEDSVANDVVLVHN